MDPWDSPIDREHGVPGARRLAAAQAWAEALAAGPEGWDGPEWRELERLDAADGLLTRRAVRALLRRPRDGRYLLFRYPFADGSRRWVIPGGGAEPGEGMVATAEREVLEETGTRPSLEPYAVVVICHLLASTLRVGREPTVQYSPVLVGAVADELPDVEHREAVWLSLDEFEAIPRRPITGPVLALMRVLEHGERPAPRAIWLPA